MLGLVVLGLVVLGLVACSAPTAPPTSVATPTPAPVPTPTFRPAVPATPTAVVPGAQLTPDTTSADPTEVVNAFLSNIDDVIAEAADLAAAPCEDLRLVTRDNPNLVASVRGYAATLKRLGSSQAVLNTDAVKAGLSDLDHSLGELEGALSQCGITQR